MNRIHEELPDKEFDQPSTVEKKAICASSGLLAGTGCTRVYEYFDQDNMPEKTCTAHRPSTAPKTDKGNSSGNSNGNSTKKKAYANWWEYYWDQIWNKDED